MEGEGPCVRSQKTWVHLCHQLAVRLLPLFLELLILIAALVVGLSVSQMGFELRLPNTGWSSLMA